MPDQAGVSVIIPCYRCSDTIERAVASVAAQSMKPAEVILVDDCSGDGTIEVLRKISESYPPGWVKVIALTRNVGPGEARNAGWDEATQPYIAFLDADDSWHPRKIEIQLGWIREHPEAVLTGHACQVVRGDVAPMPVVAESAFTTFRRIGRQRLLISNRWFSTPTVMLRRELPYRFALKKRHCEDYLLWCEICLDGHPCYWCPLPLAFLFKAHYGEAGLSGNLWLMEKGQLHTYKRLHETGRIGWSALTLLRGLSLTKYLKRLIVVGIAHSWRQVLRKKCLR